MLAHVLPLLTLHPSLGVTAVGRKTVSAYPQNKTAVIVTSHFSFSDTSGNCHIDVRYAVPACEPGVVSAFESHQLHFPSQDCVFTMTTNPSLINGSCIILFGDTDNQSTEAFCMDPEGSTVVPITSMFPVATNFADAAIVLQAPGI